MPENKENSFILYQHKSIKVNQKLEKLYCDCYKCFGWIVDNIIPEADNRHITINLKRNRKIENKDKLNELQKECENALRKIETLENSKTFLATMVAITIGLIGTGFIAGAVFSFLAKNYILHILLAFIGFAGWALPLFIYNNIKQMKVEEADRLIEQQYEIIYELCERARSLFD